MLQVELVQHARELLVPGGGLVYAACTLTPDENEASRRAAGLIADDERRTWPDEGDDGFYVAAPDARGLASACRCACRRP